MKIHLFKISTVFSLIILCVWFSHFSQPLVHCHQSADIVSVLNLFDAESSSTHPHWHRCDIFDLLYPRGTADDALAENIKSQMASLKHVREFLPSRSVTPLIKIDWKRPFHYEVSPHFIVLGSETVRAQNVFLRASVHSWLKSLDQLGLDAFEMEVFTDFILSSFLNKNQYTHPISRFPVLLNGNHQWPEEAMSFRDNCLTDSAPLAHEAVCQKSEFLTSDAQPSLWSARFYVLSQLQRLWYQQPPDKTWRGLKNLSYHLATEQLEDKGITESIQAGDSTQSLQRLIKRTLERLAFLLQIESSEALVESESPFLIDWRGKTLAQELVSELNFKGMSRKVQRRVWLRYGGDFWDMKTFKKIPFANLNQKFKQIVRIQCDSRKEKNPFDIEAEKLTLIHYCGDLSGEWHSLFRGEMQTFLRQNHDLEFITLRPREYQRFLKWNHHRGDSSWTKESWRKWIEILGVTKNSQGVAQGAWEIIEDYYLSGSKVDPVGS